MKILDRQSKEDEKAEKQRKLAKLKEKVFCTEINLFSLLLS